jgi:hypothetical protein
MDENDEYMKRTTNPGPGIVGFESDEAKVTVFLEEVEP